MISVLPVSEMEGGLYGQWWTAQWQMEAGERDSSCWAEVLPGAASLSRESTVHASCFKWEDCEQGLVTVWGPGCAMTFWLLFFFFFFDPHLMFLNRLCLEERKYLLHNTMVSKLICWYFLCNSMVKQLLRVSVWLPHHLDPEVIFKKMWTARSLCSAQVLLLQLKEGRLCSCMFPKTQQFWMGILKYCTVRAPRNRAKFQVSIFVVL